MRSLTAIDKIVGTWSENKIFKNSSLQVINSYNYTYNSLDVRGSETMTNGNPITNFTEGLITYNYNSLNQLLSSTNPNKIFIYDDDGNMTQGYTPDGYVMTMTYDAENRLKSVEFADSGSVLHRTEYFYGGDSLLAEMKKFENGVLVNEARFVRARLLPIQERDGSNTITKEYTWGLNYGGGIGGLINLKQEGLNYSYLYDGKGNVTALLGSAQNVVATYTFDPFGELMNKTGTINQSYTFSTKDYDAETGLYYYGYRFYSPAVGRWLTRDLLGELKDINLYGFVSNDAVNQGDPFGLYSCNYQVSTHTMICTPDNDENPAFDSEDFVSGNNLSPNCSDCQNNPEREDVRNHGPITAGDYDIGGQLPNSSRRPLSPDPANSRSGFQMHGCGNSATCSNGCIAATTNATRDELNRTLSLEEDNTLHVEP